MIELKEKGQPEGDTPEVKNVEKKNVVLKKTYKVGEIAHYHKQEDEEKTWEEACHVVEYRILDPKGFKINDDRYVGTVIVPQCLADHFAYADAMRLSYERNVYQGKVSTRDVGSF